MDALYRAPGQANNAFGTLFKTTSWVKVSKGEGEATATFVQVCLLHSSRSQLVQRQLHCYMLPRGILAIPRLCHPRLSC